MTQGTRRDHGALVGWKGQNFGDNLVLQVQSLTRSPREGEDEPRHFDYVLNRNQAAQLGQYLFELSGLTPPPRRKRWLPRLRRKARQE